MTHFMIVYALFKAKSSIERPIRILMINCNISYSIRYEPMALRAFRNVPIDNRYEWHFHNFMINFGRLVNSLTSKNVDDQKGAFFGRPWSQSFMCWSMASAIFVALTFTGEQSRILDQPICYCYVLLQWSLDRALPATLILLGVQILSAAMCFVVYKRSRRQANEFNRSTGKIQTLTRRLNTKVNMDTTQWILPMVVFHCSVNIVILLLLSVLRPLFLGYVTPSFMSFLGVNFTIMCLEMLGHSMICTRYQPVICSILREKFPKIFKNKFFSYVYFGSTFQKIAPSGVKRGIGTNGDALAIYSSNVQTSAHALELEKCNIKHILAAGVWSTAAIVDHKVTPDVQQAIVEEIWNRRSTKR
uniref:G protein-coupled receptor n=1 Tax=Romanomermis culicivorax TaxID=13658 RepID=A0A915JD98_ROMCU